jgi:hypothetical protein
MLKAQEVALDRQSSLFQTAFATTNELIRGMVQRINQLEGAHTKVLAAQWAAVTAQAQAEVAALEAESGGSGMDELIETVSKLVTPNGKHRGKPPA